MKKHLIALFWLIQIPIYSYTQSPELVWQNTIGGSSLDFLFAMQLTPDGGSILGGHSGSIISGDKTDANLGVYDYWVIKLNAAGAIQWQKTIGGTLDDRVYSISLTSDGGYILGGTSTSNISGNKSENCLGSLDYWVVKLDSMGNIEWENTLGGSSADYLYSVEQTSDGGYILGGASSSNSSPDKSENCILGFDYWVVKLNAAGAIVWENTIGGTNNDYLKTVTQAPDGGYILGGYSHSLISGDKTENLIGTFSTIYNDFWILKLDTEGNIVWQNTIGGNKSDFLSDLKVAPDGSCFIGGYSDSGIIGDKTEGNYGLYDYWVVKVNSEGIPLWDNTIGGTNHDYLKSLDITEDGGCILGGYSSSLANGEKTELSRGSSDYWIIKLNNLGIIEWQKAIGGTLADELYTIKEISSDNYLLSGNSLSNANGDKTENCIGNYDFWVINVATCTEEICDGIDNDCDGLIDDEDDDLYGPIWYVDADVDGYGNELINLMACAAIPGYVSNGLDCDDSNNLISPANIEIENDIDDNCDGYIDNYESSSFLQGDYIEIGINSCGAYISSEIPPVGYHPNTTVLGENRLGIVCDSDMDGWTVGAPIYCGDYSMPGVAVEGWVVKINDSLWVNGTDCITENIPGINISYEDTGDKIKSVWQGELVEKNLAFTQETLLGNSGLYYITTITIHNKGLTDLDSLYYTRIIDPDPEHAYTAVIEDKYNTFNTAVSNPPLSSDALVTGEGVTYGCYLGLGSRLANARATWGGYGLIGTDPEEVWKGVYPNKLTGTGLGDYNNAISFIIPAINAGDSVRFAFAYIFSPDAVEEALAATETAACIPVTEICNSIDDNCNGIIDEGFDETITIAAAGPTSFCQGGSVLLTATYTGLSVQWKKNGVNIPGATSPNILVTTKGTYTCETTGECETELSEEIFVNVQKNPPANITASGPTIFCAGGSVTLTANTGPGLSYQWYKGAALIPGATSINYVATLAGNYKCRVTKMVTGCFKNSNVINISIPCKEGELTSDNKMHIFPNPSNQKITISFDYEINPNSEFTIVDVTGKVVIAFSVTSNKIEIDITKLATGVYFVKGNLDGDLSSQIFIKE